MDMVQEISDWVIVMAEGRIIAEGPPGSIGENQAVVDAYLGSSHDGALILDDEPVEPVDPDAEPVPFEEQDVAPTIDEDAEVERIDHEHGIDEEHDS